MHENRRGRMASILQRELSRIIRDEVKDPRVGSITITRIDLAHDGTHAAVFFTPLAMRSEELGRATEAALMQSAPFVRNKIGKILTTKNIPTLSFLLDLGLENSLRVEELLREIKRNEST